MKKLMMTLAMSALIVPAIAQPDTFNQRFRGDEAGPTQPEVKLTPLPPPPKPGWLPPTPVDYRESLDCEVLLKTGGPLADTIEDYKRTYKEAEKANDFNAFNIMWKNVTLSQHQRVAFEHGKDAYSLVFPFTTIYKLTPDVIAFESVGVVRPNFGAIDRRTGDGWYRMWDDDAKKVTYDYLMRCAPAPAQRF